MMNHFSEYCQRVPPGILGVFCTRCGSKKAEIASGSVSHCALSPTWLCFRSVRTLTRSTGSSTGRGILSLMTILQPPCGLVHPALLRYRNLARPPWTARLVSFSLLLFILHPMVWQGDACNYSGRRIVDSNRYLLPPSVFAEGRALSLVDDGLQMWQRDTQYHKNTSKI